MDVKTIFYTGSAVMSDEIMHYDVVIVGAGPAGLSSAIKLKQLSSDLKICILEKGAEVGAHLLSGAVLETRSLDELLPDWHQLNPPIKTKANQDEFLYLTETNSWKLPTPGSMKNHGNYIISLSQFSRWLAEQAQNLGIEIYPGFAANELVYEGERVCGIKTNPMGVDKQGQQTERYQPSVEIHGKFVILAEGCRGSLSQQAMAKFNLRQHSSPQTYGIGLKEVWEIKPEHHQAGKITHTVGWPLDKQTYGGSFIYHLDNNKISFGFVIGLDYKNPYLNPFQELQRFKLHPKINHLFQGAKRLSYGARALNEGGWQSLPKLNFPGGLLIGDAAGFLNVAKIKGIHAAMKSGMLAAEAIVTAINKNHHDADYQSAFEQSWLGAELKNIRNIRPGFHWGLIPGLAYAAIDYYLLRGKAPWTFKNKADHNQLQVKNSAKKINYPKPDGITTFDRLSSVYLSNTYHEENQPCHIHLKQPNLAIDKNYQAYDSPEQRYCPGGVFEIIHGDKGPYLQTNGQNCLHCKTCDIKDPSQNILWTTPEGGGGPNYEEM